MGAKNDTPDARVAAIAAQQHGIVVRRQLVAAGLGSRAIAIRARKGQLHRVHRGVYAVGHRALSLHGRFMAAVLACGEGAVLSHGSAAVLWGLLRPLDGPVHVSIPSRRGAGSRGGIQVHRCPSLARAQHPPLLTRRHRIPVTTVPRTIHDLRGSLPPRLVRRAIRQAEHAGYRLDGVESDGTRSDLETAFLGLCRRFGLPPPEVNVKLGSWEVDFLWRAQRLVVEVDTFTYHRGSVAFEDDHARDLDLSARGYAVRRFTDSQIEAAPERVAADLGGRLATAAG
jgi:Protein of unknown function (DUF559)/Transcriptional regulator, AbiEi antitoxin